MMFIQASPHTPNIAILGFGTATTTGLYRTENGGQTFFPITAPKADQNNLDFNPDPLYENEVILCDDQGLYRSANLGNSWPDNLNSTLSFTQAYRVAASPNDQIIILAAEDAGFYKYQSGTVWNEVEFGCDGSNVVANKFNPLVFLGSKGVNSIDCPNNMKFTTDGGNPPWGYRNIDGYWDNYEDWIAVIVQYPDRNSPNTFYHPRRNQSTHSLIDINVTTDNGANWSQNPNNISQIDTDEEGDSPQTLTFCEKDPEIIYVSTKNWDLNSNHDASRLWKSIDGGIGWSELFIHAHGIPDRIITSVVTDPKSTNIVYLTVSGFGTGHVFKSTDGGGNWYDISGGHPMGDHYWVPNVPVNNMVVRYISETQRQLFIATDVGVLVGYDPPLPNYVDGYHWNQVAEGLPHTICLGLIYNDFTKKLRVSTMGRGIYEITLSGQINISGNEYIIADNTGINVNDDIVINNGSKLTVPQSCIINLLAGKKIIVEPGGQIDVSSGASVTFTSQSGTWGGIEFQGSASGTLKNCTFTNTNTPVIINGLDDDNPPAIVIDDCHFTNGAVEVTNRPGVTIKHSDWTINSGTHTDAILASGSGGIYIWNNEITYSSQVSGSHGIQLSQCNDATITQNTITNADYPITVSNATSYVRYSNISTSYASTSYEGIYLNGVNNGHLIANDVSGYQTGYYLNYYSSPQMLSNNADGSNANGNKTAIYCFGSSPRMYPAVNGSEVIWDAGLNSLRNDAGEGTGLYMEEDSDPGLDYGYNTIFGESNISGTYPYEKWEVRCNSWENDPPVFNVYSPAIEYYPSDCAPPDSRPFNQKVLKGGAERTVNIISYPNDPEEKTTTPPQPVIVDYGNGLFDTLVVSSGAPTVTADVLLLGSGISYIYLNNFETAIGIFEDVISNYQDSATALSAMDRIFYCYTRMDSDSLDYAGLRAYLLNLASSNSTDTAFVKTAMELSRKCLIKQKNYIGAISAYEDVISTSTDPVEIAAAEISIIEIYTLMNTSEGDALSFTGRYASLKPNGLKDAMKKIREKMGHKEGSVTNVNIPKEFNLSQNYPNPFNPLTKINYSVPQNITVTLKVYDILGRLVKTLVNEYQNAGSYIVTFDGSGLASGIYFYKLEAGDFVQSKKMVLVK